MEYWAETGDLDNQELHEVLSAPATHIPIHKLKIYLSTYHVAESFNFFNVSVHGFTIFTV